METQAASKTRPLRPRRAPTWVALPKLDCDPAWVARGLSRTATQVALRPSLGRARPRPSATQVALQPSLGCARPLFLRFFFFFFLSYLMNTYSSLGFFFFFSFFSDEHIFCCNGFLLLLSPICLWLILVVNRVLETRFSCRCHMEKVSHQT